MKIKNFSFGKHDTYRGEIKFEIEKDILSILTYHTDADIIYLLKGIIDSWQDKKQLVQIPLEDEQSSYDILLINYPPGDVLKIEIFQNAPWDVFDGGMEPIPAPIFFEFTDHHSFANLIYDEIKKQGEAFFDDPQFPYPEQELAELRKMMVGDG